MLLKIYCVTVLSYYYESDCNFSKFCDTLKKCVNIIDEEDYSLFDWHDNRNSFTFHLCTVFCSLFPEMHKYLSLVLYRSIYRTWPESGAQPSLDTTKQLLKLRLAKSPLINIIHIYISHIIYQLYRLDTEPFASLCYVIPFFLIILSPTRLIAWTINSCLKHERNLINSRLLSFSLPLCLSFFSNKQKKITLIFSIALFHSIQYVSAKTFK